MAGAHKDVRRHAIRPERLWLVFTGIVLGYAVCNPLIQQLQRFEWVIVDDGQSFYQGWLMSQPIMLGIWAALGPGSSLIRLALVLTGFASLAIGWSIDPVDLGRLLSNRLAIPVVMLLGQVQTFVVVGFAAWVLRRFGGWQIVYADWSASSKSAHIRFSLKLVLGMMTVWAVLLAAYGNAEYVAFDGWPRTLMFGLLWTALCVTVGLPAMGLPLLLLTPRITAIGVTGALLVATLVPSASMPLLELLFGPNDDVVQTIFMSIAVAACAMFSGSIAAIVLRWAGYRLVQIKRRDAHSTGPAL